MRTLLGMVVLALSLGAAAPAFADASYIDCNKAPAGEWAQCVLEQAQQGGM